jgi:hypothetical protein
MGEMARYGNTGRLISFSVVKEDESGTRVFCFLNGFITTFVLLPIAIIIYPSSLRKLIEVLTRDYIWTKLEKLDNR